LCCGDSILQEKAFLFLFIHLHKIFSYALYYDDGYGQYYGNCTYFFDSYESNSTMTSIHFYPNDPELTPAKVKQIIGQPLEEGWSDVDDTWVLVYDLGSLCSVYNSK
jgi:hypothetical protein